MKKNKSYKLNSIKLAILIPGLLLSSISSAQQMVIDPGAIMQAVSAVNGIMAQTQQIVQSALGTDSATRAQTEASKSIAEYQTQYARDLALDKLNGDARLQALKDFGPNSIMTGCSPEQQGTDMYKGGQTAIKLRSKMGGDAIARGHAYKDGSEILADLSDANFVKKEEIVVEKVKPEDFVYKTLEDEQKAAKMMAVATNPTPPLNLAKESIEENTLAGKKYKEMRKVYDDKALVPTANAMEYIANQSGTVPYGDWAKDQWTRMGQSGDYYGAKDKAPYSTKMMSMISTLNLDVISRYENPTFYKETKEQMDETWQLREEVLQSAVALKTEWEMFRSVRDMALMQSQNQMDHINETLGKNLENLRVDAHKNAATK